MRTQQPRPTSSEKQKPRRFRRGFAIRRSVRQLSQLQVAGGLLAALRHDVEADLLTFREAGQAGALNRGHMDEHIARSVARLDEAETLLRVEPLHGTNSHSRLLGSLSRHAELDACRFSCRATAARRSATT